MRSKILLAFVIVVGVSYVFIKSQGLFFEELPEKHFLKEPPQIKVTFNEKELPYQKGILSWNNSYLIRKESTTTILMNRKIIPQVVSPDAKIYIDFGEYAPEKVELRMVFFFSSKDTGKELLTEGEYRELLNKGQDERHYEIERALAGTIEELGKGKYVITYKPELIEKGIQQIAVIGYWQGDVNRCEYSFLVRIED